LNTTGVNCVGGAFLYRARAAFLIGEYDPARLGLEDYDYWMRVNALLRLRHADFDEPVYEYRLHGRSLTSRADELGIEPGRRDLLAFDAFRRDLYLTPLTWRIDADPGEAACAQLAAALAGQAGDHPRGGGRLARLLGAAADFSEAPSVHVHIVSTLVPAPTAPDDLPAHTLRVLLLLGDSPLPEDAPDGWDLYAARSAVAAPQRLSHNRRGWLVTGSMAVLAAAIDIRARAQHLSLVETQATSSSTVPGPSSRWPQASGRATAERLRLWRVPHSLQG
jgi:hypothetical protein